MTPEGGKKATGMATYALTCQLNTNVILQAVIVAKLPWKLLYNGDSLHTMVMQTKDKLENYTWQRKEGMEK